MILGNKSYPKRTWLKWLKFKFMLARAFRRPVGFASRNVNELVKLQVIRLFRTSSFLNLDLVTHNVISKWFQNFAWVNSGHFCTLALYGSKATMLNSPDPIICSEFTWQGCICFSRPASHLIFWQQDFFLDSIQFSRIQGCLCEWNLWMDPFASNSYSALFAGLKFKFLAQNSRAGKRTLDIRI